VSDLLDREQVLKVLDKMITYYQALIDRGQGSWPEVGYVPTDVWQRWHGSLIALREARREVACLPVQEIG